MGTKEAGRRRGDGRRLGHFLLIVETHGKEREIDFAIGTMLPKMWVILKGILTRMFKDEDAIVVKQMIVENKVGEFREVGGGIGWVGEDDVELLIGTFE